MTFHERFALAIDQLAIRQERALAEDVHLTDSDLMQAAEDWTTDHPEHGDDFARLLNALYECCT